jgi:beta-lactamase regulating signal transducer with metallopeptidase domain
MTLADRLNVLATIWSGVMLRGLIEATVLLLLVGGVWWVFRKTMSVHLSYGLFLLVLLKLAVPVPIAVPARWLNDSPVAATEGLARWIEATADVGRVDASGTPVPRPSTAAARDLAVASGLVPGISPPSRPPAATISIAAWLMIAWTVVVSGLSGGLVARNLAMHLRLRGARRLESCGPSMDLSALARKAGLRGPVPMVEVPWIDSPAVWGLFRPSVLLPPGLDASLSANGMTWVLLHELIHIRRRDGWVTLFQKLLQIVYFFHPAVWAANRIIDAQREYACDEAAVALAEVPRYDCGVGFLAVVERAGASPAASCPALGLIRSHTLIRNRLMRILDGRRPLRTGLSLGSSALLIVAATVGLPRLRAREEPAKPPTAPAGREASRPIVAIPVAKVPEAPEDAVAEPAAPKVVSGTVRDRDGSPVADVMIKGTERFREYDFSNGVLGDDVRHDWLFASTGPDGRYRFQGASMERTTPPIKEFGVFAYHEKGYARRSAEELARSADLTLEPWGRVEGVVTVLGRPLADVPLRCTLDATDQHSMFYDYYEYDARTDDRGRFAVEHVPAGVAQVSTGRRSGKDSVPYGLVSSARRPIKPGETLVLNIGGSGRPVVGKIRVLEGVPVRLGGGRLVLKAGEKPGPHGPSAEEMKTWDMEKRFLHHFDPYRSPEGRARRLAARIYSVQIRSDGTFRAVEVEPGAYTLSFWVGEDFQHPIVTREVVVPPIPGRWTDAPLDLGMVRITPPVPKP